MPDPTPPAGPGLSSASQFLPGRPSGDLPAPRDPRLWQAARALEANFLTEMLKSAGLGETPESFGGGAGEDQFASFLRQEQAEALVDAGGIGLAETLYNTLMERQK
ncbi:MAG: chemotaxis protein chel [Rhodobacteraceae bacterium]|nr:chemotaxis protein chel [Paracoccaceae bacterium]MBR9821116.1 chemotaxis protein chel [Paracoccaceae bacterium]